MVQPSNSITTAQFAAKFKSKREIYLFLTVDCKAYLCDCDNLTIYFLKGKQQAQAGKWRSLIVTECFRFDPQEKALLQE